MTRRAIVVFLLGLMLPLVAQAATRYASPNGSGSSPCTTNANNSSACSLATAIALMQPGDTLDLRGGTYATPIRVGSMSVPSGSNGNPYTVRSFAGETATINHDGVAVLDFSTNAGVHDIRFENLIFNGAGINVEGGVVAYIGRGNQRITFQAIDFQGDPDRNNLQGGCDACQFIDSKFHNGFYAIYWFGSNSLFDGNQIYDSIAYGLHLYESGHDDVSGNVISNNLFYNNAFQARNIGFPTSYALLLSSGSNNIAYNNVIRGNANGVQMGFRYGNESNNQLYNNTIYGNDGLAIDIAQTPNLVVRNNIIYGNASQISDNAPGTVFAHNLCGSNGTGCDNNLTGDPGFVSAPGGDFHIALAGSKAVNCCPRLAGVDTDADGFNRTNPTAAGAYEFGASCIPGNCPTGCCGNSCCPPNPEPGTLLAHWTFDEGSGTTAADTAPLAGDYPCELTSAGWVSPGIIGASAFSLNGSRSCQISGVPQQANLALSLWIKGTVFPAATGCMFAIGDSIEVCINSTGHPTFTIHTDNYHTITGPNVTQDGVPHHMVVSYEATNGQRLWVDGAQVAFAAGTGNITYPFGTLTQIGRYFTDNQYAYTGVIDQVRAYAAPLFQADVDSLRNEQVPTGGTAVHDMAFYDADAAEGVNGVVNADLTSLLTTPKGIRWGLRNASGADITEYFKPFCRVNTGAGYGSWVEVDNSFGSDGIRFHTDTVKNLGDATTNLLPLNGAMAGAGKFIVDTVDTTSPYDAVQKITMANGAQVDMEVRVDFGSPLGNGHLVQCKPRRESGADLTEYGGPGDPAIRTLTVQTLAPVSGIRIGGAVTGGTER